MELRFEWDERKNQANLRKHGISFGEAKEIFDGLIFTTEDTRRNYGEGRMVSLGAIAGGPVLVVVHTERGSRIRIISARCANKAERRTYYVYLKKANESNSGH